MKQLLFLLLILGSFSTMAQKITDLPAATGTGVGGVIPIVQGGVTKRIFIDSLPKLDTTSIYAKINQNIATIGTKQNILTAGTNITIVGNTINSSGGGITNYDSAFVDFTTAIPNQVDFRRKSGQVQTLAINFPSSLAAIRRVPGTLQVQGLVSGIWTNQNFIDSIGAGGSGGAAGFNGDTLFFTTIDGNLNSAVIIPIANGEGVKVNLHWIGIKADSTGASIGEVSNTFFRNASGAIFVGVQKYPNDDELLGTANAGANLTLIGSNISGNVIGQGTATYKWKIWVTIKRYKL